MTLRSLRLGFFLAGLATWPLSGAHAQPTERYSPRDAGAKCDGRTDDTEALEAWWTHLMRQGGIGELPSGTCLALHPLTWDMSARRNGVRIEGASQGQSILDLRGVRSGTPLLITASGGMFYSHFSDFTVLIDVDGPGVQLGKPTLTDAMNGFTLTQIEFKNAANAAAAVALQINGCFNCNFQTVTTNTGGGSTTGAGRGVSLQVRYAAFSRFMGSFSNAGTGLHLTSGYVFGNTFEALDIEVVDTAVLIDSPKAARNSFIGGQFVAMTGLNFTAGNANIVSNPNLSPYKGGVPVSGATGLWLQQAGADVATPPVPHSGEAIRNTTGRMIMVLVSGGAASRIVVGASAYALSQGSVLLRPGETVTLFYTTQPALGVAAGLLIAIPQRSPVETALQRNPLF